MTEITVCDRNDPTQTHDCYETLIGSHQSMSIQITSSDIEMLVAVDQIFLLDLWLCRYHWA